MWAARGMVYARKEAAETVEGVGGVRSDEGKLVLEVAARVAIAERELLIRALAHLLPEWIESTYGLAPVDKDAPAARGRIAPGLGGGLRLDRVARRRPGIPSADDDADPRLPAVEGPKGDLHARGLPRPVAVEDQLAIVGQPRDLGLELLGSIRIDRRICSVASR